MIDHQNHGPGDVCDECERRYHEDHEDREDREDREDHDYQWTRSKRRAGYDSSDDESDDESDDASDDASVLFRISEEYAEEKEYLESQGAEDAMNFAIGRYNKVSDEGYHRYYKEAIDEEYGVSTAD